VFEFGEKQASVKKAVSAEMTPVDVFTESQGALKVSKI